MKQVRERITLRSEQAELVYDLGGGGIVGFCLTDPAAPSTGLTPLAWNMPGDADLEPREMAHFLVCDRWCDPTEAEACHGMPFNGEATHVFWRVDSAADSCAVVSADLPMAGLTISRTIVLAGTVLQVEERITNRNPLGRPYNLIEHATIGPPFLDESVMVDANVARGFTQEFESGTSDLAEREVGWPCFPYAGNEIDMRRLFDNAGPLVTSYIFTDDVTVGWVTACNPGKQLLIGYLWDTTAFPWLNLWRHVVDGQPMARGLEFGTTGLLQPYPVLVKQRHIFDRQLFEWIDADETITKRFTAFLATVPADFAGVALVRRTDKAIHLTECGDSPRQIVIESALSPSEV